MTSYWCNLSRWFVTNSLSESSESLPSHETDIVVVKPPTLMLDGATYNAINSCLLPTNDRSLQGIRSLTVKNTCLLSNPSNDDDPVYTSYSFGELNAKNICLIDNVSIQSQSQITAPFLSINASKRFFCKSSQITSRVLPYDVSGITTTISVSSSSSPSNGSIASLENVSTEDPDSVKNLPLGVFFIESTTPKNCAISAPSSIFKDSTNGANVEGLSFFQNSTNDGSLQSIAEFTNSTNNGECFSQTFFLSDSTNNGKVHGQATFSGNCSNNGEIFANGLFYSASANTRSLSGGSYIFSGSCLNNGSSVIGNIILMDGSTNSAKIIGKLTLFESTNHGQISGSISSSGSFNDGNVIGESSFLDSSNEGSLSGNSSFIRSTNEGNLYISSSFLESTNAGNMTSGSISFKHLSLNEGNLSYGEFNFVESINQGNINNSSSNFNITGYNAGQLVSCITNFGSDSKNFGSIILFPSGSLSFNKNSINLGVCYGTRSGMVILNDQSVNKGTINFANFNNRSINSGNISNEGLFNNFAVNESGASVRLGIFKDRCINSGNVIIGAFYENTINKTAGTNRVDNGFMFGTSKNFGIMDNGYFYDTSSNKSFNLLYGEFYDNSINYGDTKISARDSFGFRFCDNSSNQSVITSKAFFCGQSKNVYSKSLLTGVCLNLVTFKDNAKNYGLCISSGDLYDSAQNHGVMSGGFTFYDSSKNLGFVEIALFLGNSTNEKECKGAFFSDSGINNSSITGYKFGFAGYSINNGPLMSGADFYDNSINNGKILYGDVSFKYDSYEQTFRYSYATNNGIIESGDSISFMGRKNFLQPNTQQIGPSINKGTILSANTVNFYRSSNMGSIEDTHESISFEESVNYGTIRSSGITFTFSDTNHGTISLIDSDIGFTGINSGVIETSASQPNSNYGGIINFNGINFNKIKNDIRIIAMSESINYGIIDGIVSMVQSTNHGVIPNIAYLNFYSTNSSSGTINQFGRFDGYSINYGKIDGSGVFFDNSENYGTIEGNAIFGNESTNGEKPPVNQYGQPQQPMTGIVNGYAIFNNQSVNNGIVIQSGIFTSSLNQGTVKGNGYFLNGDGPNGVKLPSVNKGIIEGDAFFYYPSYNEGIVLGNCSGAGCPQA